MRSRPGKTDFGFWISHLGFTSGLSLAASWATLSTKAGASDFKVYQRSNDGS